MDLIEIPKPLLQVLFDLAVNSMDFGSGFWEQEDIDVARHIAIMLDVCPNAATPREHIRFYPECEGTVLWRIRRGALRLPPLPNYWEHDAH